MLYESFMHSENPEVTINVKDFGTIKIQLFQSVAPNTVANFAHLVSQKYYDGLIFHRIIPGFMIQGGWGQKDACAIKGEFSSNGIQNDLTHDRGVISMARTNDPNSASSQFFIMHQASPHLNGQYAAFGAVFEGIEVVDKIAVSQKNHNDKPLKDIVIESMTIDLKGQTLPKPVCYSRKV
ncbi:MAG: peptidylprolyl isomerase [Acholeplasmataceae bacterium]